MGFFQSTRSRNLLITVLAFGASVLSGCSHVPRADTGQRGVLQSDRRPAQTQFVVSERTMFTGGSNDLGYIWPIVNGSISSPFGDRQKRRRHHFHEGIDIKANRGEPVMAAKDGVVIYSSKRIKGYGNMVVLKHPDGSATVYAHNKKNLVVLSERVSQGQVIAQVGATGKATGPHLHFEIRKGELPIDPILYLPTNRMASSNRSDLRSSGVSKKSLN